MPVNWTCCLATFLSCTFHYVGVSAQVVLGAVDDMEKIYLKYQELTKMTKKLMPKGK